MAYYRQRIRKMERKYKTDFDGFSKLIQGKATPEEEDDWFEWKSAMRMLIDWKQSYQELHINKLLV